MGMTVTNPAQPSSFYESRQQRMPARRTEHVRSTGLIVSRSPPDWNILESIPRMAQRRNTAVPSSNTMVATKASLKGSERMKALTDILGKRKREIVDCKPSSLSPKAVNISPPRKLLKPISNIKPPDAPPPPKTKSGPRLKLETTAPTISSPTARKPKVVVSSRVTQSTDSTPTKHTGYVFDLKNAFNFQSKCAPVPPKSTTTVVHDDTLVVGTKSQEKLPSKLKFNWSEWGRKS
ncbi:hypothetical protein SCHPADRAFT_910702 [Schizopora paradoxa]|uniref:Uncharacterized protein n=1 Tax=Schizopora paradoxa TaxID=27342 RepID=A0A0H2R2B2_9AGAM|nr:hypothetical protein SCHPADRAFT_910702 [Schizopora paradoxa]